MPYRVKLNDLEISCDTYADLRQLLKEYGNDKSSAKQSGQSPFQHDAQSIKNLVSTIKPNQKKILTALMSGSAKSDTELRDCIGADNNNALAGTLAGLVKNFKRLGLDPSTAILKTKNGSGETRTYQYRLSADFLEVCKREGLAK